MSYCNKSRKNILLLFTQNKTSNCHNCVRVSHYLHVSYCFFLVTPPPPHSSTRESSWLYLCISDKKINFDGTERVEAVWNVERWAGLWVSRLFLFPRKTGLRIVVAFNLLLQNTFGLRAHYLQNSYGAFKGNNPFKEKKNSWWMQIDIKFSLKKWSGFLNMIIISGNSGAESNHYWSHSWGWHGRTAVNSSEKEFFPKAWGLGMRPGTPAWDAEMLHTY